MRVCQLICVGLPLLLPGCASWHRPDTVYQGQKSAQPVVQLSLEPAVDERSMGGPSVAGGSDEAPLFSVDESVDEEVKRPNDPQAFDLDSPTLTPPVQGVSHRTGYRGEPERARAVRTERRAPHPPGLGYIELPPPPDLK